METSFRIAASVWWAFIWRSVFFATLIGFALGLLIGFSAGLLGIPPSTIQLTASLVGIGLGVFISIWVMRSVLRKKFKKFHLAVISNDLG